MKVYVRHMRAAGVCVKGSREWCKANNIDFREFVRDGIDAEILKRLNDPITNRLVEAAERENGG